MTEGKIGFVETLLNLRESLMAIRSDSAESARILRYLGEKGRPRKLPA